MILYSRYKHYLDAAWADKPDWLEMSNYNLQCLQVTYKSLPKPRIQLIYKLSNINDVINSFINLNTINSDDNKYDNQKRYEPITIKGTPNAESPIKYQVGLRD